MTADILDYLSGRMPLGIWIIPIAGAALTLIWWVVWRGTGFWTAGRFRMVVLLGWAVVISIYTALWSIFPPPPIPVRVLVRAESEGAWGEAIADAIRSRLRADPKHIVVLDAEVAPALFQAERKSSFDSLAQAMRIKHIIAVDQDSVAAPSGRHRVGVAVMNWSGSGYGVAKQFATPDVTLAAAMVWAGEQAAIALGGKDMKGAWPGRPGVSRDSLLIGHYHACSLRRQGQTELAAAFFAQEADADTTWSAPRVEFARTWLYAGPGMHEEEIRKALFEAVEIDRQNPEIYLLMGRHFLEFRDWEEAESALKLAYHYCDDDPRVHFYLSRLMDHRLKDLPIPSMERLIERSLQLAPGYETARLGLIDWLRKVNKRREASEIVEEGLKIDPHSPRLLLTAAAVFLELHQYPRAAALCERLIAEDSTNHEAIYNLGLCRLWQKRYDEAIAEFDKARQMGGSVENIYYLGVTNQIKGDYPEAIKWYQRRYAAAQNIEDKGAISSRERIQMLRGWIIEDSLKKAGWKPSNPFERPPTK